MATRRHRVVAGSEFGFSRTFTLDDVRRFSEISGDEGDHHVTPDAKGRVMVQGLLTASLPTRLGGEIDFVSSEMAFRFHRPVYTGDTVTIVATADEVSADAERDRTWMRISFECSNQHGKVVMDGSTFGFTPGVD